MSTDKEERWYVQFDSGDVTLMTLDEIQEAFEAGKIHANTYLIEVGETEWKTLSIVAGLDDENDGSEDELTPASTAAPAAPVAPAAPTAYTAPSAQPAYAAPGAQRGYGAQVPSMPGAQTVPAMRSPAAAAGGGWPPVATAPQSVAPAARTASISTAPPAYQSPYSMMPVVADLDVGLDARSFKSGRKTALVAALFALPAIGGGIYALAMLDAPPSLPPVAAAAAAPAAMPRPNSWSSPAATTPPPTPTPTPTPTSESNSGSSDSASSGRLSDDMKKALLANDSARTEKKKAARASAPARRSGKKGDVFKAGGAATDPLNSKL